MKMPEVSRTPQADRKHGESEVTIEFFKGNMVNIERLTVEQAKALYQSLADFLDGAPEPEWEWAVSVPGDDEPFSDVYQTREHLAEQETGIAWGEEQLVRRRKAGPWLPVEGESKP